MNGMESSVAREVERNIICEEVRKTKLPMGTITITLVILSFAYVVHNDKYRKGVLASQYPQIVQISFLIARNRSCSIM